MPFLIKSGVFVAEGNVVVANSCEQKFKADYKTNIFIFHIYFQHSKEESQELGMNYD